MFWKYEELNKINLNNKLSFKIALCELLFVKYKKFVLKNH